MGFFNAIGTAFDGLYRLDLEEDTKDELKRRGYANTCDVMNASEYDLLFKTNLTNGQIKEIKRELKRNGLRGMRD